MSWIDAARSHIAKIHDSLPFDASYADRVKALRDGYPWSRQGWAYKAWLTARREYLARYSAKIARPRNDPQTNFDEALK